MVVFADLAGIVGVGVESVAHGHLDRAVAVAVGVGGAAHGAVGVAARSHGVGHLLRIGPVAQHAGQQLLGVAVGIVVVACGERAQTGVERREVGHGAPLHVVEQLLHRPLGDVLPRGVDPAAAAVGVGTRGPLGQHGAQRGHDGLVVERDAAPQHR